MSNIVGFVKRRPRWCGAGVAVLVVAACGSFFPWATVGVVAASAVGAVTVRFGWWKRPWEALRRRLGMPVHPPSPPVVSAEQLSAATRRPPRKQGQTIPDLVETMLLQGRYALLLRPQIVENLNENQLRITLAALQEKMALVPAGVVVMSQWDTDPEPEVWNEPRKAKEGRKIHVEPVFLDRYAVSNFQFQEFVLGGGYEELEIWDETVLPAMLEFVDQTGHPGPRGWFKGQPPAGLESHPVVGISWYEATAYARWCGKRLPTDAEWAKAACWPVSLGAGNWVQRKYPWGDSFEMTRANVWASARQGTVPVDHYDNGLSVGGLYQMIGNVWEWMAGPYGSSEDTTLSLPTPMKAIRGGAFDTYFESQAACQFQSGENPLRRKHNIGLRLALGACDLAPQAAALILEGDPVTEDQLVVG